ncbi:MAG: HigA family addiction module antidote protein [Magnetococcales bacterium]|nr:HigA family addiction module antidote protein [Magnetococcales bacterium]
MNKKTKNPYLPDYLVTPGEVLNEYLEAFSMTQAELATRTGLTRKTINEIIQGIAPITPETALKLERIFNRPAHFWNNLESQYQEDYVRIKERSRLQSALEWLKRIPVKEMIAHGWMNHFKDDTDQLEAVLRFFGIASPEQWKEVWETHQVAYRQTQRFETHDEAVSAWLRQGEIQAQQLECAPFDKKQFQKKLQDFRSLTTMKLEDFHPLLIQQCAAVGVAVVFVPELPKTGISGATRWLGKKAVIQLSLRYKSNDHLWFTFFHEAGHILKHGRKGILIEGKGLGGQEEEEANLFSQDLLIPPDKLNQFLAQWNKRSLEPISRFADEIGIAPGIVVGRLQHDDVLSTEIGNLFKIKYSWDKINLGQNPV